jgi:GTP cyclohydrolase II
MLNWLAGHDNKVAVERAVAEIQAGRAVIVDAGEEMLVHPVDPLGEEELNLLRRAGAQLAVSPTRAAALGLPSRSVLISLPHDATPADVRALSCEDVDRLETAVEPATPGAIAAITLAKLARQVPAMLIAPAHVLPAGLNLQRVTAAAIDSCALVPDEAVRLVSRARVPLRDAGPCEFVVFRAAFERTSTAIVVGTPDFTRPVPVRLHSACLTGDAFSSLRCDCGDQLRMALVAMKETGGILLYLDQEGCGIGLANKMRAYRLQDRGLDTVDANRALGFAPDERQYAGAAAMLNALGVKEVLLLTNNPSKMDALASTGIRIAGRLSLIAPMHGDNRRYLEAKARRAGHLLDRSAETLLS